MLCVRHVYVDKSALYFTAAAAAAVGVQINAPFGAGVVSSSTGIMYGNTMGDFAQPNK